MSAFIDWIKNTNKLVVTTYFMGFALIAGFVLPFAAWTVGQEAMGATGGPDFCVSCHTMDPFEQAYELDVHGGNSSHGVQATCVDCHLPHDNAVVYFVGKAQTGLHDIWVENTTDTSQIDWRAKREHREDYVYDSGCLHCHNNLEQATKATNAGFIAHKAYFSGEIDDQCVTCHQNVGHKNLTSFIP